MSTSDCRLSEFLFLSSQDSGLLKMAQCLALKKAVARLSQTSSGPAAQHHPYPFSTSPQSYPSPSYPNSSVPQPYSSASHLSSADPQAYRTPSAPTLSAPEAYSSASHPNVVPQPFRKPPAPYPITPEQWQTQPQPYSASQPGYPGSAASHLGASPYTGADRTDGGAGRITWLIEVAMSSERGNTFHHSYKTHTHKPGTSKDTSTHAHTHTRIDTNHTQARTDQWMVNRATDGKISER